MKIYIFLLFLIITKLSFSQEKQSEIVINPHYSLQFPASDMAKDYGISSGVGFDFLKFTKDNFIFGFESKLIFGNRVKNNTLLSHLMDNRGNIFGDNGEIASISLFQRGYQLQSKIGYLYHVNEKGGILSLLGLGFVQHKTRIQVESNNVPQLNKEYLKMYDNLSNGLNGNLFIGWLFFLKNSQSKLYSGIDFNYANTQNRRSYNYYANGPVNNYRKDILIGIKIGWTISLSKRNTKEFYYY